MVRPSHPRHGSTLLAMGNIGGGEILVILLVALIVFGPDKLPEVARQVGKAVGEATRRARSYGATVATGYGATVASATRRYTPRHG